MEALEQLLLLFWANANAGVGDGELQKDVVGSLILHLDMDTNLAVVAKLDRIADEVDQNLAKPEGIAPKIFRDVLIDLEGEFDVLTLEVLGVNGDEVVNDIFDLEFDLFDGHFSRFNFGEVQNVLNQHHQMLR